MNHTNPTANFDGCNRRCRLKGAHTLVGGDCEHAPEPEPTVSLSRVYTDTDGRKSIGFDEYNVPQLAELITAGLRASDLPVDADAFVDIASVAAHAIVHRNDEPAASTVLPEPTSRAASEDAVDRLAEWLWDNCAEDERSGLLADDPRRIATVALHWPELRRLAAEAPQPCPTPCDPDCDAACHEVHQPPRKRDHQPNDHAAGARQQPETEAPVVAYRSPGTRTLYCLTCARQETGWQPVTDADEQTVCDFCGGRVHAVAAQTLAGAVARYLPSATPTTETQTEDPARIDRMRPEFTEHASVESIDAQLRRARSQQRRWHLRVEWLISLRQARVDQKARGKWPAPVEPAAAEPEMLRSRYTTRPGDATVDPAMCPRCKGDNREAFELCDRCAPVESAAADGKEAGATPDLCPDCVHNWHGTGRCEGGSISTITGCHCKGRAS